MYVVNTIAENTKKLLRMRATLNVTLRDMNEQKLENGRTEHALNSVVNNDNLIAHFLPLDSGSYKAFQFFIEKYRRGSYSICKFICIIIVAIVFYFKVNLYVYKMYCAFTETIFVKNGKTQS